MDVSCDTHLAGSRKDGQELNETNNIHHASSTPRNEPCMGFQNNYEEIQKLPKEQVYNDRGLDQNYPCMSELDQRHQTLHENCSGDAVFHQNMQNVQVPPCQYQDPQNVQNSLQQQPVLQESYQCNPKQNSAGEMCQSFFQNSEGSNCGGRSSQTLQMVASYGGETYPSESLDGKDLRRPWSYGGTSGGHLAPPVLRSTQKQLDEFEEVINKMATMSRGPPPYSSQCAQDSTYTSEMANSAERMESSYSGNNFPIDNASINYSASGCGLGPQGTGTVNGSSYTKSPVSTIAAQSNGQMHQGTFALGCQNNQFCPNPKPKDVSMSALPPSYPESHQTISQANRGSHSSPRPSPYPSPLTSPNPETPPPSNPSSRRSSINRIYQQVPVSPVRIHVSAPWEQRPSSVHYNP